MKNLISFSTFTLVAVALVQALSLNSDAANTVVWGGGDGDYATGANWQGGSVPNTNGGDTAVINGGAVTYTAGGDLHVHAGGALQVNGGSWTQGGGGSWIQLGGGSLIVSGGVFNQGSAGNINRDATSQIIVSSGTANLNGDYVYETASTGSLSITGGAVNISGEFKPYEDFSMTAGSLKATIVAFAGGSGNILFSGGTISLNGANNQGGFYGGGGRYLDFSSASTGSLFLDNYNLELLTSQNLLTSGTIRYSGAISAGSFSAVESGGGVYVTVIPEPSPSLLLLGGVGTFLLVRRRHLG